MVRMVVVLVCCWCVDEEFEFGAVAEYGFVLVTGVDKLRCPCCCVDFFVEAHIFFCWVVTLWGYLYRGVDGLIFFLIILFIIVCII